MIMLLDPNNSKVKFNYNLAHLTWLKVGGPAEVFYRPDSLCQLQEFITNLPPQTPINTIGAGSNLLIRDGGVSGATVKLGGGFSHITLGQDFITVGAATLNYNLAHFCCQNSLQGFEFLIGIPGNIGGGIAMNAGAYGREFKDIVHSVKVLLLKQNVIVELSNSDVGFYYRGNSLENVIFLEAKLRYEKGEQRQIKALMEDINLKRKASQPISEKTCGSTFANPIGHKAWELIERVGMRGSTLNNAQISNLHCNFLINKGSASAQDLEDLATLAQTKVLEQCGVELKWEVKRLGKKIYDF